MRDFQKRKAFDNYYDRKKMRFMKKSRWEMPIPKSTSYWKEICDSVEKKVHRVRDRFSHFPFISFPNNNLDFDPLDSAEFNNLSKVQSYHEPIVKISPPTPLQKSSVKSTTDVQRDKISFDKKYTDLDKNLILKLRSLIETRKENHALECKSIDKPNFQESKIYSKKTCPYHKNEPPILIFDDDLKKYLPKTNFSAKELNHKNSPDSQLEETISKSFSALQNSNSKIVDKKVFKILERHKSPDSMERIESGLNKYATNLSINEDLEMEYDIEKKSLFSVHKTKKIPKLGKASLLASFAKTISISSSIETHESSDEDYSKSDINIDLLPAAGDYLKSKLEKELKSSETLPKDYLRVPKLGYASLHPSFRKLVPIDSFPDEEEVTNCSIPKIVSEYSSDYKFEQNIINLENMKTSSLFENSSQLSLISSSKIERTIDSSDSIVSKDRKKSEAKCIKFPRRQNHSTRYAYRALKVVTKNKDLRFFPETIESERESLESSFSSSLESGYNIRKNNKSSFDVFTCRNIRDKLRRVVPKYLGQDYKFSSKNSEPESKTIVSASRSTSGASPVFQIPQLKSKTLTGIPSIKIYPRRNSDRCLPCLYKSFKNPKKVNRELPMTILSSIIKEPFKSISSSDTSSVSLPDLNSPDFESLISNLWSNLESNLEPRLESFESDTVLQKEVNKKPKFSDNESIIFKDQSFSPESTDLRKVSIKSSSAYSTDFSKPSSPSGQSSESEDARPEVTNGSLNTSKYLAPCHAPVVWKPSLESLRALRLRKATSMQSRTTAITSKSNDDSDLEDSLVEFPNSEDTRKRDRKAPSKTVTIQSPDLKIKSDREDSESRADFVEPVSKDKRKKLMRTKTIAGKLGSLKVFEQDKEKRTRFIRAQTSLDLSSKLFVARKMSYFEDRDSAEDSMTLKEDLFKCRRQDSQDEGRLFELSNEEKEILEILEKCTEEDEFPGEILKKLCNWYSKRVSEVRKGDIDPDLKKALKIAINLLRLLAESRRYLNSDNFSPDLEFSSKQPPLCNSRQLRRVLPLKSYNLVAPILNMPQWYPKKSVEKKTATAKIKDFKNDDNDEEDRRRSSVYNFDLFVHPPSVTEPSLSKHFHDSRGLNPYALFLAKPRRKAVTWRPLNKKDLKGYNPDASLSMRASKITDKICHEFCEWLRGLSGSLERVDEEVLKDMFQIIFTADACKSMQVIMKEMPTVPKPIALIRNSPGATELAMTRKELIRDIKIEKKPKKTFAFGSSLPKKLRFVPPQHQIENKWFRCENVPQELETMDTVWNGIKHLESVKGFVDWLKNNTSITPPDILMHDITTAVSVSRFSQEDIMPQVDLEGVKLNISKK